MRSSGMISFFGICLPLHVGQRANDPFCSVLLLPVEKTDSIVSIDGFLTMFEVVFGRCAKIFSRLRKLKIFIAPECYKKKN